MIWEWPQITMVLLYALGMIINYLNDGQSKADQKYSFKAHLVGTAISIGILYAGGFWGAA